MNLAERRVVAEFESNHYPELQKRVEEAAGFAVPIEVRWESLAVPGESHLYREHWPLVFFEPLIIGLSTVCRDATGKEAVRNGLHKVVIQNTKGCCYGSCWASFADGVLTLDHEALTNSTDIADRTKGLVAALEGGL